MEQTRRQFEENEEKQREFGEFRCQNLEVFPASGGKVGQRSGINVVTNRADLSPRPLYDHYSDRRRKTTSRPSRSTDASVATAFGPISFVCCCTPWPTRCS